MKLALPRIQHLAAGALIAGLFAALSYSLSRGLGLVTWLWALVATGAVGTALGITGSHRPKPVLITLTLVIAASGGVLALPVARPWWEDLKLGAGLAFTSTGQAAPPPALVGIESLTVGLLLFAGGVLAGWLSGWLVWRRASTMPLLLVGTGILGAQWLWFVESAKPAMVAFWLGWVVLAGLVSEGSRRGSWSRRGARVLMEPGGQTVMVSALLAVLLTITALSLPSRIQPVSLEALSQRLADALPRLEGLRGATSEGGNRYRFTLARTGFGRSQERLGGPVRTDQREALQVRVSGQDLPQTLYLRGSIDTEYTGRGWRTPSDVRGEMKTFTDMSTFFPARPTGFRPPSRWGDPASQSLPGSSYLRLPSQSATVTVTAKGLRTSSLFIPIGTSRVSVPGGKYLVDQLGTPVTERPLGRDEAYLEEVLLTNESAAVLETLPTGRIPPQQTSGQLPSPFTLSATEQAPYLALPGDLPPRIAALAREITAGAEGDYQRMALIESYLRSLPYSLEVSAPPQGRDFVDYFLFDLKQGYCSYSSSAMTVMARSVGVPARWVQGFAVPLSKGQGTYSVLNSQAHAWVEVFFTGYGWVVFDPTPRYTTPDRSAIAQSQHETPTAGSAGGGAGGTPARPRSLDEDADASDVPAESLVRIPLTGRPWWLTGLVWTGRALPAALGLALILLPLLTWWRERLPGGDRRVQMRALYRNLDGLLSRFDHGRRPDQTPLEWLEQLGWRWPDLRGDLVAVATAYQAARYGSETPVPQTLTQTRRLWRSLRQELWRETPALSYLWRRLRP